jgi:TolA-binding protein
MKEEDIKQVKSRMQSLETRISDLAEDAEILFENDVDTTASETIREEQEEIQDELEQLASDILALLNESSSVKPRGSERRHELVNPGRSPVQKGKLPQPRNEYSGQGPPPWAGPPEDASPPEDAGPPEDRGPQ